MNATTPTLATPDATRPLLSRLAWPIWVVSVLSTALACVAGYLLHDVNPLSIAVAAVVSVTIWAIVATQRPELRIAHLFLAGSLVSYPPFALAYLALYTEVTRPGRFAWAVWVFWVCFFVSDFGTVLSFLFTFQLFPTGRLLSARWRVVMWLVVASYLLMRAPTAFQPGPFPTTSVPNPAGNADFAAFFGRLATLFEPVFSISFFTLPLGLMLRFWRSRGEERQQLKWLAYAAVVWILFLLMDAFLSQSEQMKQFLQVVLRPISLTVLPLGMGIAILRYHLYDIDLLIRRTLVYSIVSAVLALVYFGGVVLLQSVFEALTGQNSPLAVVASTLAIAALFTPLRRLVQDAVDRRFYRRRYNAQQVLDQFAATVRDETDIGRLEERLLAIVEDTMQPAQVGLWLKRGN